jgi:hypothetical protein
MRLRRIFIWLYLFSTTIQVEYVFYGIIGVHDIIILSQDQPVVEGLQHAVEHFKHLLHILLLDEVLSLEFDIYSSGNECSTETEDNKYIISYPPS